MTPPDTTPPRINGWLVLSHPLFGQRYRVLVAEAQRLKGALPAEQYVRHPQVKLLAAVQRLVTQIIPANPDATEFRLRKGLARFRRAKGFGLPSRYRLFWAFSRQARTIVFLYLNDEQTLRKASARTDPYELFQRLVARGEIGADFEANLAAWRRASGDQEAGR